MTLGTGFEAGEIPRVAAGSEPRLSFAQERMFLLEQLAPGVTAYNVPRVLALGGTLDETVLQQALVAVAERHELLRTTIELIEETPTPRLHQRSSIDLTVVDLRGADEAEASADELLAELAWKPFDLDRDRCSGRARPPGGPRPDSCS